MLSLSTALLAALIQTPALAPPAAPAADEAPRARIALPVGVEGGATLEQLQVLGLVDLAAPDCAVHVDPFSVS